MWGRDRWNWSLPDVQYRLLWYYTGVWYWTGGGTIKGRTQHRIVVLGLLLTAVIAACRPSDGGGVAATRRPTITPTPLSTALPEIATLVPTGLEGNPLRMVVVPVEPIADEAREAIVDGLAQAIKAGTETGIVVEVLLVDRYAEAMAALCDSGSGLVSIAWLDGVTFAAAQAQNCGQAALQVRRGTGRDLQTALAGQIILSGELGTTDLDAVRGRNFCRLGLEDFYSWFVPWLVFKTQGIDLLNDADAVVDHDDLDSLVAAVASGECAAAGIAEDALSALLENDEDLADQIEIVETTTPFPFAILLYPLEVQLGVRLDLNDVLIAISENEETEELLRAILGQDSLARTTPDDFEDLLAFMNETGLDLAQLGN